MMTINRQVHRFPASSEEWDYLTDAFIAMDDLIAEERLGDCFKLMNDIRKWLLGRDTPEAKEALEIIDREWPADPQ